MHFIARHRYQMGNLILPSTPDLYSNPRIFPLLLIASTNFGAGGDVDKDVA